MLIDDVEPDREFVQRVSIHVNAAPHETMRALREVTLRDMPLASFLGELRYLPGRITGRGKKSDPSRPFIDQVLDGGSIIVAERKNERSEEIVIGGIGKYHQIVDQQPVRLAHVEHYHAFDDSQYQKLAMEISTVATDGGCDLALEAHTHPLGTLSKKAFARYWVAIDPMGRFVSWLLLRAARRRAEGHVQADRASMRWKGAQWPAAAACTAAAIAWVSTDLLALPREAFVLPYMLAAGVLTALFIGTERIDVGAAARRHPVRALLVTAIIGGLVVGSVFAQPGAPRAHGVRLAFELAWDGVAYGAVDGVLLTVVPIAAIRRAFGETRWTSDALALLASIAVFVVYHLGFPEFRGAAIGAPIVAGVLFGAAYLASRNPLVPVVAHVAMHVAAVLHGPAGTMQLPPHY